MLPDVETLLAIYYTMPMMGVLFLIVFAFGIFIFYLLGFYAGREDGIKYVWAKGERHSAVEHQKLYTKFKNGIDD